MRPSREEVLGLLRKVGVPPQVISHSLKVENVALRIAEKISNRGHQVDAGLVSLGSLMHDIGRSVTHDMGHGIMGGKIIRKRDIFESILDPSDREKLARICERHIGAGITEREARRNGLPDGDYVPQTMEEKILAHADNLVWNGILSIEESRAAFRKKFGEESPIVRRIEKLGNEITKLMRQEIEEDNHT